MKSGSLVVLSACDTGSSSALESDDLVGFPTAFVMAGAAASVASRWPVDDAATALLMGKFHEALTAGEQHSSALRSAQLWLRELKAVDVVASGQPGVEALERVDPRFRPYQDPFHWAAFSAIGEWRSLPVQ